MEKVTITTTLTKQLSIPKIRKGYTARKCENMYCEDLKCEMCIYDNENKVFRTQYLKELKKIPLNTRLSYPPHLFAAIDKA